MHAWVVLLEAHLLRRRPVAVALAAAALASAFGVAMTKQKMEELQGAGEDPLQHKEQMGGLIGMCAAHTMMER